jgi:hypothetical protein
MRSVVIAAVAAGLLALSACKAGPAAAPTAYANAAWGFSVSFHGAPKVTETPATADGKTDHVLVVENTAGGRDELVRAIDGSGSTSSDDDALSSAPAALAKAVGGTLGPITYSATGKVVGREFLLNRTDKPAMRVRVFVANRRLYEIIAQAPDDAESTAFLDSFKLS